MVNAGFLSGNAGRIASASSCPEPENLCSLTTHIICASLITFLICVIRRLCILGTFFKNQILYLFIFTIGSYFIISDLFFIIIQFSSVAQLCPTLCDPMDYSTPGLPITNSQRLLKLMSIESVMPFNHLILCRPLLLLPSIFPSSRVFSNGQLFTSGGQSIGVSASTSVLPMNIQD